MARAAADLSPVVRKMLRSRHLPYAAFAVILLACGSSPANRASIGVMLGHNKKTGALHVREVPPGLTGDEAGLRSGDRIKMIDGMLVDRLAEEKIRELLGGEVGSKVRLTIVRKGQVLHLEVTRQARVPKGTKKPAAKSR